MKSYFFHYFHNFCRYWRLISSDADLAKKIVLGERPPIDDSEPFLEKSSRKKILKKYKFSLKFPQLHTFYFLGLLKYLVGHIGSLSSVLYKPEAEVKLRHGRVIPEKTESDDENLEVK